MVRSTKSPRSSYSRVRSFFFTIVTIAVLPFSAGCNTAFPPSTGDGRDPAMPDSSVPPRDSTTGGSVAPADDSGPSQPSLSISSKRIFCCDPLSIDFVAVHADPFDARRASRYTWAFGDGFTRLGKAVNHTYGRPATYTVEVVATYVDGSSEQTATTLTVGLSEPPPSPDDSTAGDDSSAETPDTLYADAGPDRTINGGDVVILDGGNSRGSGTATLTFVWRQLSGPAVQLLTFDAGRATFVAPTDLVGTFILSFELTVGQAASSGRDVVRMTVVPAGTDTPPIDPTLPSQEQLTVWMAELPELPKVHYSHPDIMLDFTDPRYLDYVRITHAVGISGEYATAAQIKGVVRICEQINATGPAIPASIGINYSPWHKVFGQNLPPTDTGPTHVAELALFRERLSLIQQWLADENLAQRGDIRVTAVVLDTERFAVKPPTDPAAAAWNAAIDAKHTASYDIARGLYPDARIEWFDRGMHRPDGYTEWKPIPYFTYREPGEAYSCELSTLPEVDRMKELFSRTNAFAVEHDVHSVTPWVRLGAGSKLGDNGLHAWTEDWDFDTLYSAMFGWLVNRSWGEAEIAVFHPAPFESRTPAWGKHFVAYVRGAAEIDELP